MKSHDWILKSISIRFDPRDIWLGVFWDRRPGELRMYVCIVPLFPVLFVFKEE